MLDSPIVFIKDPGAKLDYSVDWTLWLDSDTIASSSWVIPSGLFLSAQSATSKIATVWLTSGTVGHSYEIVNQIQTANGRIDERTFTIIVRNK